MLIRRTRLSNPIHREVATGRVALSAPKRTRYCVEG